MDLAAGAEKDTLIAGSSGSQIFETNRKGVPSGLRISSMRRRDLEEVVRLYNDSCSELPRHSRVDMDGFEDRFIRRVPSPMHFSFRDSLKAVLPRGRQGQIVGFTLIWMMWKGRANGRAALRAFAVSRDLRGLGIGRELLQSQIGRLFGKGIRSIRMPGIQWTNQPALHLLRSLGASLLGESTSWEIDLSKSSRMPKGFPDPDLNLKDPSHKGAEELYEAFMEVFRDHVDFQLADFKEGLESWKNPTSIVATVKGEIAGFAFTDLDQNRGYFDYVGVKERFRNRGIGTRMVMAALRRMVARGISFASTGTTAENMPMTRILKRLGFRKTSSTYHMIIRKPESQERGGRHE